MTDPRPRPQYGEYATPEDQAKAMGLGAPKPDSSETDDAASVSASTPGQAPPPAYGANGPVPYTPGSSTGSSAGTTSTGTPPSGTGSTASTVYSSPASSLPSAKPLRKRRTWDVVLTAVLLGLGVASLLSSYPQYADFPTTINLAFAQLGYGALTATDLASAVGIGLNVAQIVLLVSSGAAAILLLRRGRLAFYLPLIGGALFIIVMIVLLVILLANDPSMLATVSG